MVVTATEWSTVCAVIVSGPMTASTVLMCGRARVWVSPSEDAGTVQTSPTSPPAVAVSGMRLTKTIPVIAAISLFSFSSAERGRPPHGRRLRVDADLRVGRGDGSPLDDGRPLGVNHAEVEGDAEGALPRV